MNARQAAKKIKSVNDRFHKRIKYKLNEIAYAVMQETRVKFETVYKNPVPYTLRGPLYKKAEMVGPGLAKASVYIQNDVSHGTPQASYLAGSIQQKRWQKPSDYNLKNIIGVKKRLIPSRTAPTNKYGNYPTAKYKKVLEAVGRRTYNKRKKHNYFYINKEVGKLSGMIFEKTKVKGVKGKYTVKPEFLVADQIEKPRKIFNMYKFVDRKVRVFAGKKFTDLVSLKK